MKVLEDLSFKIFALLQGVLFFASLGGAKISTFFFELSGVTDIIL